LNPRKKTLVFFLATIVGLGLLAAVTFVNLRYVAQNPGGSDFLPRYVGTREYFMTGHSPYSKETTEKIQTLFYGRVAKPEEDQVLFVYPFYSIFVFAPFALFPDFNIARAIWMTVLEVSIILITIGGISLSRWKLTPIQLGALLLFSVLSYYSIRSLINANASVLVSLFLVGALLAIRSENDGLAGFLLAFSTIKPQVVVLAVMFIMIWAISHRRFLILWSFLGTLALLVAVTSLLIPDWVLQNIRQVLAYPAYTLPGTPGAILYEWLPGIGKQLGWAITIIISAALIWEWRAALFSNFRWFLWTTYFTLTATTLVGIRTATENYIILLPAMILVFAAWEQEWGWSGKFLIGLSYIALLIGVWWLFLSTLQRADQPIQNSIMFFPLPVFLIIGLYWIRWWVIRPERPLFDQLRNPHRLID